MTVPQFDTDKYYKIDRKKRLKVKFQSNEEKHRKLSRRLEPKLSGAKNGQD